LFLPNVMPLIERVFSVSGLVATLVKHISKSHPTGPSNDTALICWEKFSLSQFLNEVLDQMCTPIYICAGIKESCSILWPKQYHVLEASAVLIEVDRSYKRLAQKIAKGKIVGRAQIEEAWIKAHKAAAQKVAPLLGDLPDSPPLKDLLDFLERSNLELGRGLGNTPFPVNCLEDGSGFSAILVIKWKMDEDSRDPVPARPESVASSSRLNDRPLSISPEYLAKPISEISPFPLESELDEGISEDDYGQEEELELVVYGRRDHSKPQKRLTYVEKAELTIRAAKLFFAFLPFLVLGFFLLLLACSIDNKKKKSREKKAERDEADMRLTWRKKWVNQLRKSAFEHLLQGCREGGAAFIKWGQWSASREDLFPPEFCEVLSALHDRAPVHSMRQTRREIQKSFGRPVEEIFEAFEHEPLASGSVAQVHRAMYRLNGRLVPVIVKVRHPNVGTHIHQDFQILKPLASMAASFPALKNLPLEESVSQFSNTMTAQTDFRVEAAHIKRFGESFAPVSNSVVIPTLIDELVSESVLVETFEEGFSVSRFIKNPSELNTRIVSIGVDAYLKMLLSDNFVHTDLHPGNILVREVELESGEKDIQIVLLDFGLAEELGPRIRKHFISFLNLIVKGDGYNAARHILQWSEDQKCLNPSAFIEDMKRIFKEECNVHSAEGIDLDSALKSMLRCARKHQMSIDSEYASLALGAVLMVGFAKSLDPRVNLMDAAATTLLTYALTGRVVGRLYG